MCHRKHTITTRRNKISCEHCGYLTSLDDRYGFTGGFRFADFAQWYDWQKSLMEKEIRENAAYALSSKVELRLPGTGNGEMVEIHYSIRRIYRLLFGAGVNFEIYDGSQILFFVPEEKRSAVDWYLASMILYDEAAGAAK